MKNKYKGLAEYLVKKDQYLALNLEQAEELVRVIEAFFDEQQRDLKKFINKEVKPNTSTKKDLDYAMGVESFIDILIGVMKRVKAEDKSKRSRKRTKK